VVNELRCLGPDDRSPAPASGFWSKFYQTEADQPEWRAGWVHQGNDYVRLFVNLAFVSNLIGTESSFSRRKPEIQFLY
jgi:hypothetical protein